MDNAIAVSELRGFLLRLVEGSSSARLPPLLRSLTRQALRSAQSEESVDDTLGAFLLRLVEATQVQSAGSAARLLLLDDRALVRVVRYRLRQVACEQYPRWALVKSLRALVRRALSRQLPVQVEMQPETLLAGDRLCSRRVAEAVGHTLGQSDPPPRTVVQVSERLMHIYFPVGVPLDLDGEPANDDVEEEVATRLDASVVAARFQSILGRELTTLVALRHRGKTLREVADWQRLGSVTTAHARLREAETRLGAAAKREGFSRGTARQALASLR
jgi:hypothetical protein